MERRHSKIPYLELPSNPNQRGDGMLRQNIFHNPASQSRPSIFHKSQGIESARKSLLGQPSTTSKPRASVFGTKSKADIILQRQETEDFDLKGSLGLLDGGGGADNKLLQLQIQELEKVVESANSELTEKKRQVLDYQQKVINLQKQNTKLQVQMNKQSREEKVKQISIDSQKTCLESHEKRLSLKSEELLNQEKLQAQKLQNVREELKTCQAEFSDTRRQHEEKLKKLREERKEMEVYLEARVEALQGEVLTLRESKKSVEEELRECKSQRELGEVQVKSALKRSAQQLQLEEEADKMRIELARLKQQNKEYEEKLVRVDESVSMVRSLKDDLEKVRTIETMVTKLKAENDLLKKGEANYELLQDKYDFCKQQLERSEARCAHIAEVEADIQCLREKLRRWQEVASGCGVQGSSPEALAEKMRQLEEERQGVSHLQGELQDRCEQSEVSRGERVRVERELDDARANSNLLNTTLARLNRKVKLIQMERDHLRQIKETYENEMTSSVTPVTAETERVGELEREAEERRAYITSLEADLQTLTDQLTNTLERRKAVTTPLPARPTHSDVEVESLKAEVARLQMLLKDASIQGFITANLKVFEFVDLSPCEDKLLGVEEQEVDKLRQRLAQYEHGGGPSTSSDVSDLRYKRALEAFEEKTKEFRRILYLTTGYMIDMSSDGKHCTMSSVYAAREEDKLHFTISSSSGDVNLIRTDMFDSLRSVMDEYLPYSGSIPALLGAIQVELFNQSTKVIVAPVQHQ